MDFVLNNWILVLVAFVSGGMLVWPLVRKGAQGPALSVQQVTEQINTAHAVVVDLRDPAAYNAGHITHAKNASPEEVLKKLASVSKSKPVILVCESGSLAPKSVAAVKEAGFEHVHVLDGGMTAWRAAGFPTISRD